tara:strand:- start:1025 stop:3076 length:2052 start_codon:yes stop_codon:yes gene_type:complete
MQINSITIENIRSYLNETIAFNEGSTLLSGDIGSGKSTILLAIEFALFGAQRGEAAALLRNGKHEGSVELTFTIENKEYSIKRKLKRSASVSQETGYIIKDGVKKEGSAVELKSDILNLLEYPQELLTKKNLVYRYTVYTPQEAMKLILMDNKEYRIDTLRKVFGVDKYKRIRENAEMYAKEMRQTQKILAAKTEGLEFKQKQKLELLSEIKIKENALIEERKKAEIAGKELDSVLAVEKEHELKIKELNEQRASFTNLETELKNKVEQHNKLALDIDDMEKNITSLDTELKKSVQNDQESLVSLIKTTESEINIKERGLFTLVKVINEAQVKKNQSIEIKNKIQHMKNCLVCLQEVSDSHKKIINDKQDEIIKIQDNILIKEEKTQSENEKLISSMKAKLVTLREQEKQISVIKMKSAQLSEQKTKLDVMKKEQEEIKGFIGSINTKKAELFQKIESQKEFEQKYQSVQENLKIATSKKQEVMLKINGLEKEKQGIERILEEVNAVIKEKLMIQEKIVGLKKYEEWITKMFVNLMITMEKHVMAKLYHEFNELFKRWFTLLLEDENIIVELDDEFAPIITQNGYQIGIDHLSGGEKTSCALSYRLSLNQVINDLIGTIKTKDLIILDEPTDGFSTEQLDKIRDLLDQINIKQIIVVSHEKKIESFVDHVIQVKKEEHISSVY